MKKLIALSLVFVSMLCATGKADILGTVDIENHNNNLSSTATLYGTSLAGESGGNFYTGLYSWTNNGGTGLGRSVPNYGFCIELPQGSANGSVDVMHLDETPMPAQYGTPMGIAKANEISELWGRYFDSSWLISPGNTHAQAFSFCVWEIVYGSGTNDVTSDPGFHAGGVDPSITTEANTWLASLNGTGPFAPNLVAVSATDRQDYLVQVPEPMTIGLLGLGSLLFVRRK